MIDDDLSHDSLIALIGPDAVARLSEARGGRSIYVPHRAGQHSPLVQAIGADAALKLASVHGGITINVPISPGKRARIRAMLAEGLTASEIARRCQCTERHVYYVKAEDPPEPPPLPPLLARMQKP